MAYLSLLKKKKKNQVLDVTEKKGPTGIFYIQLSLDVHEGFVLGPPAYPNPVIPKSCHTQAWGNHINEKSAQFQGFAYCEYCIFLLSVKRKNPLDPLISGPVQFRLVVFKGQLYILVYVAHD